MNSDSAGELQQNRPGGKRETVDDDIGDVGESPSAEGSCTTAVRRDDLERLEVRETAAVYRLSRLG